MLLLLSLLLFAAAAAVTIRVPAGKREGSSVGTPTLTPDLLQPAGSASSTDQLISSLVFELC
jgi:hypothetical protein